MPERKRQEEVEEDSTSTRLLKFAAVVVAGIGAAAWVLGSAAAEKAVEDDQPHTGKKMTRLLKFAAVVVAGIGAAAWVLGSAAAGKKMMKAPGRPGVQIDADSFRKGSTKSYFTKLHNDDKKKKQDRRVIDD